MRVKFFSLLLLAALSGCGGGGSGGSPGVPTPPVEPASLSVVSMSPASSSTSVNPDSGALTVTLRAHGYSNPRSGYKLTCGPDTISPDPNVNPDQWNASTEQLVVSAPYNDLPGNSNCEMSGTLAVDTPPGAAPNTLSWSLKFTTATVPPLRYGPTVVGILGGRMFALTIAKPYVVRVDTLPPPLTTRGAPAPWLVGTALTPTGHVPTVYGVSGASGTTGIPYRFNPVTAKTTATLEVDPFPGNHTSISVATLGSSWMDGLGGIGPAPTATAKYWTTDGSGGWFYVETSDAKTLLHRDATGAVETVASDPTLGFSVLRTLSN